MRRQRTVCPLHQPERLVRLPYSDQEPASQVTGAGYGYNYGYGYGGLVRLQQLG